MSKTDCIVCLQDGILTNGSNLNISVDPDEKEFICYPCFQKQFDNNGGLRIFDKYDVCDLCCEYNGATLCMPCLVKMQHSRMNGFLTIGKIKDYE